MAHGRQSKQARQQYRDAYGRFADAGAPGRRGFSCGTTRDSSRRSEICDARRQVSPPSPRSETSDQECSSQSSGGRSRVYIELLSSSDEERPLAPSSAPGPSRATGDERLPRLSAARGTHPCRVSVPQTKKRSSDEEHDTVTANGGNRRHASSNTNWLEFYGEFLQAHQEKELLAGKLAEEKRKNQKLNDALAREIKKNQKLNDALAGFQNV